MIFTPDIRPGRRALGLAGAALAAFALASGALASGALASGALAQGGVDSLAAGRAALARGDAIAAEMELRRALETGTPRAQVAAGLGEAEYLQGDFVAAREWLGPGEFAADQRMRGFHMLARIEMADGNLSAAGEAFRHALEGGDGSAEMWVDIGRLRYSNGEHHQAIEASLTALERDPKNPRALEFRGLLVRDSKGLIAALSWFEEGLKHAPDDIYLLGEYAATLGEAGRAKDMLRVTRQMIKLGGDDPRAYYLQAVLAARVGKNNLARRLLWRTKGAFDAVPAAQMLTGILELRSGNSGLAVEAFADMARRLPDHMQVQELFAAALLANGEANELVARYAPAAGRKDASVRLLTLVGRAYEQLDDRAAAAPFLDRAAQMPDVQVLPLGVSEEDELTLFRWGGDPYRLDAAIPRLRKQLADGQFSAAAAGVNRLAERYGGSADFETLAGDVALALGDPAGAVGNYRAAAQVRRSFPLVERMAIALKQLDQAGAARALVSDYLRQHPQHGAATALLAQIAAQQRDWRQVRLLMLHLQHLGPLEHNPPMLMLKAQAELELGEVSQARASAAQAYRRQRANGRAALILGRVLERSKGHEAEARAVMAKAGKLGTTAE